MSKWILSRDRLPEEKGRYLVVHGKNNTVLIEWFNGKSFGELYKTCHPKAWMPLPEEYGKKVK